ncbi:MAG: transporter, family, multidrug resistance protein [Anaerophaga sp.]|uniref:MFS transporter n=1 Tax=Anaerophaga thermohalophila TaxID=177400 RepID=UPI000237D544|nr:MFS transporter [Anaerophaga thermohalophila]MDK2842097.1 transporter, family, multidrug resistance protein [Anaerophaga sp.]MDN5291918.1 transporter, family, multidrug resistance protein [Anaerophaga sp.]
MDRKNITVIFLITLTSVMGVASITPALPQIVERFNITPTQVALLITVFTFPGIFLAPFAGLLADKWGRKKILLPSLLLFGASGIACFFTRDWEVLLVLRFFQGVGAAPLSSLNLTLIGDLFSGERRAAVMGYNASVLSIGTALYPGIGGVLAMAGWQYPFLLPLLAIPTAIMLLLFLKNPEPTKKVSFTDYIKEVWSYINKKTVWGLFLVNILMFVILYGSYLTYFPQLLKERFQAEAWQIGLTMSAFSIVTATVSSQLGRMHRHMKPLQIFKLGFVLYGVSMLGLAFVSQAWQLVLPIICFGIAHGIMVPSVPNVLVTFAPNNVRAGFMSINGMILRTGQTLGPVTIGFFYMLGGTSFAFIGGAIVAVCMFVISLFMIKL